MMWFGWHRGTAGLRVRRTLRPPMGSLSTAERSKHPSVKRQKHFPSWNLFFLIIIFGPSRGIIFFFIIINPFAQQSTNRWKKKLMINRQSDWLFLFIFFFPSSNPDVNKKTRHSFGTTFHPLDFLLLLLLFFLFSSPPCSRFGGASLAHT